MELWEEPWPASVPNGDILIHAGNFTMFSKSASAILDFNEWLGDAYDLECWCFDERGRRSKFRVRHAPGVALILAVVS